MSWFEERFQEKTGRLHMECAHCRRSLWFPPSKHGLYKTCGGSCADATAQQAQAKSIAERERPCRTCGSVFVPRHAQIQAGNGKYCSQACNVSSHQAMNRPEAQAKAQAAFKQALQSGSYAPSRGENNPKWMGGSKAYRQRAQQSGLSAERLKKYRQENKHKVLEFTQRRKHRKLGRLPKGTVQKLGNLQRWKCAICRCGIAKTYHLDHVQPLAKGGRHEPNNLQLLCPTCNVRKAAKDPISYMQEIGFLL